MYRITINQKGFTLIELLIAMAIGAIVLLAAYNVFVSQQKSHKLQSELVDAEQNARAALDLLTREIRLAGSGVQRAILNADVAAGASTLTVVSSTGFGCARGCDECCGEIINIATAGAAGVSEAVNLDNNFTPAAPYTALTLSSTTPTANSYNIITSDVSIFKEKITAATENSITFRASISPKETNLVEGAGSSSNQLLITNNTRSDFDPGASELYIFIDDKGGRFERVKVNSVGAGTSAYDIINLNSNLINSYPINSLVTKGVDTVTYSFDSANDMIRREFNGGGAQPFAENIDYFQIRYFDGNNNPIPNPAPSLYKEVIDANSSLSNSDKATLRSKIRKVNIQIVAISSKDDTSHTETGTYEDGTTYEGRGSKYRRRIFLESDILMTNMIP